MTTRSLVKSPTREEANKRVKQMEERGWKALHEPKEVHATYNQMSWVVTMEIEKDHNPKNKPFWGF